MLGVILAAGKGTRLKSLGKNVPKALIEVGGKPCIEHIILGMKKRELPASAYWTLRRAN